MKGSMLTRLAIGFASLAGLACGGDKTNAPTTPGPVATVTVVASATVVAPGQTVGLTATLLDGRGLVITDGVVQWSTTDPEVATVTATGDRSATVKATGVGSVEIKASNGSHTGSVSLRIDGPLPQEPQVAVMWSANRVITALGTLPGGQSSYATAMNDGGQIVGTSTIGGIDHGFLWTPGQGMVDIGTLPGFLHTYPTAINNSGQVVGAARNANEEYRAFLWSAAAGMVEIPALPGASFIAPAGINDAGVVVGALQLATGGRGFRWTSSGGMQVLAPVPGDLNSEVSAVNAAGTMVGTSDDGQYYGTYHAARWDAAGAVTAIPVCGTVSNCSAFAVAISPDGQVAGTRIDGSGIEGFRWTSAGGATAVGVVPSRTFSFALGINDLGQVVGDSGPDSRAFFWTQAGGIQNLGVLSGKYQSFAVAINKNGQIAGTSQ